MVAVPGRRSGAALTLRVGVASRLRELPPDGHGRVWRQALRELERRRDLVLVDDRPDVWLTDIEPVDTERPAVTVLHEASWVDADFRAVLLAEELEWMDAATRLAVQRAARVVVPAASSRDQLEALTGCDTIDVVPYGVDHRTFRPRRGGARLVGETPYVLFVGVAHPKKNIDVVRAALTGLDAALALVVMSSQRPDAAALLDAAVADAPGLHLVRLHTPFDRWEHTLDDRALARVMSGAACLVLPSLGEGFGLPAAEAMACGCPVVCSDRGALPEVVGDAGLVVPPTVEAVRGAVSRLLIDADLRARLGGAGRSRAAALTWDRTAEGWARALHAAAET